MNTIITQLLVRTRKTVEAIRFSKAVTFIYGPISKGKSTVLRLIDYCLGGGLERTPAIQQEFISAELSIDIGNYRCLIERSISDRDSVRISWSNQDKEFGSILAPIKASETRIINADVYNLSDLLFYLGGTPPIKVRQKSRDPDSPLIRLSFRDIWWYCYLNQADLDSSFFRFGHPYKERKSKDALRFFTGLYSERLSQAENEYLSIIDKQRTKRNTAKEIRIFMQKFDFGSEQELLAQIAKAKKELLIANKNQKALEEKRSVQKHPTDSLRVKLRHLGDELESTRIAILDLGKSIEEQKSLRAELIMSKTKTQRLGISSEILDKVDYLRCPECGGLLPTRENQNQCKLCGQPPNSLHYEMESQELEGVRRDLNDRIDQIGESITERQLILDKFRRILKIKIEQKRFLDEQLQHDLQQYDTSYIESMKIVEREISALKERILHLNNLLKLPTEIDNLEHEAGKLQGIIDVLKIAVRREREALNNADKNVSAIADEFKRILLSVKFPGVSTDDIVSIDTRTWKPYIHHGDVEWSFWECGSLGKKTLFNACYALAIHVVAIRNSLPVPSILIIDSPTKNISEDEDPGLVSSLYSEIYNIATAFSGKLQLILVDSELVKPKIEFNDIIIRRMAGTPEEPSLISYYEGP